MMNLDEMQVSVDIPKASSSHLPNSLVGFALVLILTYAYVILIQQPIVYWAEHLQAVDRYIWNVRLLSIHPLVFCGVVVIFTMVIGLLLKKIPRSVALIMWMGICFICTESISYESDGLLQKYFSLSEVTIAIVTSLAFICLSSICGGVLAHYVILSKKPFAVIGLRTAPIQKFWRNAVLFVILAVWIVSLNGWLLYSMYIPKTGWRPIKSGVAPSPRYGAKIAYDTHRGVAVLFGGVFGFWECGECKYTSYTETWEWNGDSWAQIPTEVSPPERGDFAMAYDAHRKVTLLFGGSNKSGYLQDTWEWNGREWKQIFPASKPPARVYHAMAYDPGRKEVIVFGGEIAPGDVIKDAWAWDGQEWQSIPINTDTFLNGNSVVYNHVTNGLMAVRYGTWFWDGYGWHNERYDPIPCCRQLEGLAYDSTNAQVVLFGGSYLNGDDIVDHVGDTWIFNAQGWEELNVSMTPQARKGHVMFYDETRKKVIVFGGWDGVNYLNDMWELDWPPK
jgi:hypothetical protein